MLPTTRAPSSCRCACSMPYAARGVGRGVDLTISVRGREGSPGWWLFKPVKMGVRKQAPARRDAYEAETLFPVFAERVMSPRRSDHPYVMDALGLSEHAEAFAVLARSGGCHVADTIELVPVPEPDTFVACLALSVVPLG